MFDCNCAPSDSEVPHLIHFKSFLFGFKEEVKVIQLPPVSLDIPKVLANKLEDDCYNIKRRKKVSICYKLLRDAEKLKT